MGRTQGRPFSVKMRFGGRPGLHFASHFGAFALVFGPVCAKNATVEHICAPRGRFFLVSVFLLFFWWFSGSGRGGPGGTNHEGHGGGRAPRLLAALLRPAELHARAAAAHFTSTLPTGSN